MTEFQPRERHTNRLRCGTNCDVAVCILAMHLGKAFVPIESCIYPFSL